METDKRAYFINKILPFVRSLQGDGVQYIVTCTSHNEVLLDIQPQAYEPSKDVSVIATVIRDKADLYAALQKSGCLLRFAPFKDFLSPEEVADCDVTCPIIMLMTDSKLGILLHKDESVVHGMEKEFAEAGVKLLSDEALDEWMAKDGFVPIDDVPADAEESIKQRIEELTHQKIRVESILESAVGYIYSAALSLYKEKADVSQFRVVIVSDTEMLRNAIIDPLVAAFPEKDRPQTTLLSIMQEDGTKKEEPFFILILRDINPMEQHCVAAVTMRMGAFSLNGRELPTDIQVPRVLILDTNLRGPIAADIRMEHTNTDTLKGSPN